MTFSVIARILYVDQWQSSFKYHACARHSLFTYTDANLKGKKKWIFEFFSFRFTFTDGLCTERMRKKKKQPDIQYSTKVLAPYWVTQFVRPKYLGSILHYWIRLRINRNLEIEVLPFQENNPNNRKICSRITETAKWMWSKRGGKIIWHPFLHLHLHQLIDR